MFNVMYPHIRRTNRPHKRNPWYGRVNTIRLICFVPEWTFRLLVFNSYAQKNDCFFPPKNIYELTIAFQQPILRAKIYMHILSSPQLFKTISIWTAWRVVYKHHRNGSIRAPIALGGQRRSCTTNKCVCLKM